ncbi:hypothetical protein SAMN05421770_10410 [Granulicella rosea]|uniref:GlcNAc-PI de-N-acetylase n=2 Tax=Granulicella rosea TaxID=474952 RepID=A0A239JKF5_9BACT|nr:hypothetical protein SAMN05421770_10410 [Granulicella rosea]
MPQWLASRHRVTVLNVFTRSLHAPYSDADTVHENDRLAYISSIRRKEDEQLLKAIPGLAMVDLNMKDAPIRLHCEGGLVHSMESSAEDTAIPKIRKALAKLAAEPRAFHAVLLPLALGNHVDHRVVRDAGLAYLAESQPGLAYALYENLPASSEDRVEASDGLTPVVYPGKASDAAEWKRRVSQLYASQIEAADAEAIAARAVRLGGERVWGNAAWTAAGL